MMDISTDILKQILCPKMLTFLFTVHTGVPTLNPNKYEYLRYWLLRYWSMQLLIKVVTVQIFLVHL